MIQAIKKIAQKAAVAVQRVFPKKPPIRTPYDVHFVVNARSRKLKCYDAQGQLRWVIDARCEGSRYGYDVPGGDTPPGLYLVARPEYIHSTDEQARSFGPWFCDLEEQEDQERSRGRAGIGVHGGRGDASLAVAYHSKRQGWLPTHGCIRLQNEDMANRFVPAVVYTLRKGGSPWLTVVW